MSYPMIPIVFKKLFGVKENKDILSSLLNSVVSAEDTFSHIAVLNPYIADNCMIDQNYTLNINAKNYAGESYCVELKVSDTEDYEENALHEWSKSFNEKVGKYTDFISIKKGIGIHFLNFLSVLETEKIHNTFVLSDSVFSEERCVGKLELHTIEINKFNRSQQIYENKYEEIESLLPKVKNQLDRWVMFFSCYNLFYKDELPTALSDPPIQKAFDVLKSMRYTKQETEILEGQTKWFMALENALQKENYHARMDVARNLFSKGFEIGLAQEVTELPYRTMMGIKTEASTQ